MVVVWSGLGTKITWLILENATTCLCCISHHGSDNKSFTGDVTFLILPSSMFTLTLVSRLKVLCLFEPTIHTTDFNVDSVAPYTSPVMFTMSNMGRRYLVRMC